MMYTCRVCVLDGIVCVVGVSDVVFAIVFADWSFAGVVVVVVVSLPLTLLLSVMRSLLLLTAVAAAFSHI